VTDSVERHCLFVKVISDLTRSILAISNTAIRRRFRANRAISGVFLLAVHSTIVGKRENVGISM
jgi:hypothetical protein